MLVATQLRAGGESASCSPASRAESNEAKIPKTVGPLPDNPVSTAPTLFISLRRVATAGQSLTAADSRIRDADFAVESAQLTQAQIIQQAGVAILAQANVIPRMALNLLQEG